MAAAAEDFAVVQIVLANEEVLEQMFKVSRKKNYPKVLITFKKIERIQIYC